MTPQTKNTNQLKSEIEQIISQTEGEFAVAFSTNENPEVSVIINGDESFHAASTMKTPVMFEVFKQASEGKFNLDDSILVKNEFTSILDGSKFQLELSRDSGEKLYESLNKHRTIKELVFDMITVSSNLATNILIDLVQPGNVMKTLHANNIYGVKVLRGVEDMKAFNAGMNNTVTAKDLMNLFKLIDTTKQLPEEYRTGMLNILLSQEFNSIIPGKLPKGIKVAHKTGSIDGVRNDSGIIFLPDGRKYYLVILSKNLKDENAGVEAGAEISKKIYEFLTN
jgi:beta-lactamase class A